MGDAIINMDSLEELRLSAVMIRTWIPEVFPENASGQVHFVRAVCESVAEVIDRVLSDTKAYHDTAGEIAENYHRQYQRATLLHAAIGAIYRAQIYEHGNKENGVSAHLIAAISHAAELAGFKPANKETSE